MNQQWFMHNLTRKEQKHHDPDNMQSQILAKSGAALSATLGGQKISDLLHSSLH